MNHISREVLSRIFTLVLTVSSLFHMFVADRGISLRNSGHPSRIEITILSSFTNGVRDAFFRFPNPAPLLTTLLIRFDHDVKAPIPESPDGDDTLSLLFGKLLPRLSMLSLKSLRPWTVTLSLTLATLTLTLLYFSANDLYPCLKAVPNLTFLCSAQYHVVV